MNAKPHFRHFFEANPERLHFAAHSHHPWPDVSLAAQQQCWMDAARLADRKWDLIFAEVYPQAQAAVARILGLKDPRTLAFGPNTHGFVLRLMSCLPPGRSARILTSDGEFHSFARQVRRLEEDGLAEVARIAVEPQADFSARFAAAAQRGGHDLVFLSQVFFDSGFAPGDLEGLVAAVPGQETLIAIDGYHAFMARPCDLGAIEDRVFFLAGGYKYAMSGENAAFIHVPEGQGTRPRDTGWYAAFGTLAAGPAERVAYGEHGARFLGATFDPVGLYRLRAVLHWLQDLGVSVADIHAHAHALQTLFIELLAPLRLKAPRPEQLVVPLTEARRGNFLTFRTPRAAEIRAALVERQVTVDVRGDRLRVGFGLYHDEDDVARLAKTMAEALS